MPETLPLSLPPTELFHPISAHRASGNIIDQIKTLVFAGKIAPGDRLPFEKQLAEQFGVSRITVRDALRVLESQGLIQIKVGAGGGTFVARPDSQMVSESLRTMLRLQRAKIPELAEARQIIETAIAALAAERATAADFKALEESIAAARAAFTSGDPHFTPSSVSFHVALAHAAQNQVLLFTVNSFRSLFYEVLEKLVPDPEMAQRAIEDHQKILDAVHARDSDRARDLMRTHLQYFETRAGKLGELEIAHPAARKPTSQKRRKTRKTLR